MPWVFTSSSHKTLFIISLKNAVKYKGISKALFKDIGPISVMDIGWFVQFKPQHLQTLKDAVQL